MVISIESFIRGKELPSPVSTHDWGKKDGNVEKTVSVGLLLLRCKYMRMGRGVGEDDQRRPFKDDQCAVTVTDLVID